MTDDHRADQRTRSGDAESQRGPAMQRTPEGMQRPDPQQTAEYRVKKPSLFIRLWHIRRRRQQKSAPPNWAEKITAFLIFVTACIAGLQACIYHQQKTIMESSGKQTQDLIDAAQIQASASRRIVTAARRQA